MKETLERLALPSDSVRGPNCGVTSVAICAGVSFKEAWNCFNKRGNWKGSTRLSERKKALKDLGVEFVEMDFPKQTLKSFVKYLTRHNTIYSVTTANHVVTVLNDYVIDQSGCHHIDQSPNKQKRVRHAIRIEK